MIVLKHYKILVQILRWEVEANVGVVNKATREITWTKPLEMADPEEKIARIDAQAKQYA